MMNLIINVITILQNTSISNRCFSDTKSHYPQTFVSTFVIAVFKVVRPVASKLIEHVESQLSDKWKKGKSYCNKKKNLCRLLDSQNHASAEISD